MHPSVDRKRVDQYIFKFVFHFERGDLSKDSRKLLNATKMMEVTYRSEFKHTKQFLRGAENKKILKKRKKRDKKFNFINSQFTGYQMWS